MKVIFSCCITFLCAIAFSQEEVSFYSAGSLKITADLYLNELNKPFIILFHQAESSRGEYRSIAPKLKNLGYNCLAVDLRSGRKSNYVKNQTAERARKGGLSTRYIDTEKDMVAALNYIQKYNNKPIVLLGSSYSASLVMKLGSENTNIKAVVAFSPGEYFKPDLDIQKTILGLNVPIFLASTELENNYLQELVSEIPDSNKTVYKPNGISGVHGAKALWEESPGSKECWFQLTYFFGKLED